MPSLLDRQVGVREEGGGIGGITNINGVPVEELHISNNQEGVL
jgi:hypothetical protein